MRLHCLSTIYGRCQQRLPGIEGIACRHAMVSSSFLGTSKMDVHSIAGLCSFLAAEPSTIGLCTRTSLCLLQHVGSSGKHNLDACTHV